jgi:hypothetical protein
MKYINIDGDTWLIYDTTLKRVIETTTLGNVDSEIVSIDERVSNIPPEPTAQEFEEWGRANMPRMNYSAEVSSLTSRKTFLEEVKRNIS